MQNNPISDTSMNLLDRMLNGDLILALINLHPEKKNSFSKERLVSAIYNITQRPPYNFLRHRFFKGEEESSTYPEQLYEDIDGLRAFNFLLPIGFQKYRLTPNGMDYCVTELEEDYGEYYHEELQPLASDIWRAYDFLR